MMYVCVSAGLAVLCIRYGVCVCFSWAGSVVCQICVCVFQLSWQCYVSDMVYVYVSAELAVL